jgi:hypothetical protein
MLKCGIKHTTPARNIQKYVTGIYYGKEYSLITVTSTTFHSFCVLLQITLGQLNMVLKGPSRATYHACMPTYARLIYMNPWLEINNLLFTYLYMVTTISETNHRTCNT